MLIEIYPTVDIDVTNEIAFRTGVVKYLQILSDRTYNLPELKKKVDKHENIVMVSKYAGIPFVIAIQEVVRHIFSKVGF